MRIHCHALVADSGTHVVILFCRAEFRVCPRRLQAEHISGTLKRGCKALRPMFGSSGIGSARKQRQPMQHLGRALVQASTRLANVPAVQHTNHMNHGPGVDMTATMTKPEVTPTSAESHVALGVRSCLTGYTEPLRKSLSL